jgi:cell wall-associated NlpC family hydrolase
VTLRYEHLVGLPYSAERDCYELGRDFFRDNFGIELTPYARPHDWSADRHDLIRQLHEREGFRMLPDWTAKDIRPADVFCLAIGSSNPNHFAIYVGDNKLLHHLRGRFSSVEPYRDFYRNSTTFLLRHPDVPDLRPVLPETTIEALLRERYNPRTA